MSRKKIDRIETGLQIVDINAKGMGVAKNDEGVVYFIKGVIPGDVVDVQAYKKGRRYFEAKPIKWIEKSTHSSIPPCQHFGVCGGCKLQHLAYEGQLEYKEKGVLHNLNHIGKIDVETVLPIARVENPYYYRNKMEFSFSNKRWLTTEEISGGEEIERNGLGFHKPGMWDKVVDVEHCHLQAEPSNEIRNAIKAFAIREQLDFFDTREQQGFLRTLMIRNTLAGEVMVLIQFFKEEVEKRELLLNFLREQFPQITSLLYCINGKGNDSLYDQNIICYHGQDFITEHLDDLQFKITAKSFYQTNPKQAKVLYAIGQEFAALKGNEIVYDLYT